MSFFWVAHKSRVAELMKTYADTPMDFGDACLMALYETQLQAQPGGKTVVITTDDDFRVYRTAGGEAPRVLMPPA